MANTWLDMMILREADSGYSEYNLSFEDIQNLENDIKSLDLGVDTTEYGWWDIANKNPAYPFFIRNTFPVYALNLLGPINLPEITYSDEKSVAAAINAAVSAGTAFKFESLAQAAKAIIWLYKDMNHRGGPCPIPGLPAYVDLKSYERKSPLDLKRIGGGRTNLPATFVPDLQVTLNNILVSAKGSEERADRSNLGARHTAYGLKWVFVNFDQYKLSLKNDPEKLQAYRNILVTKVYPKAKAISAAIQRWMNRAVNLDMTQYEYDEFISLIQKYSGTKHLVDDVKAAKGKALGRDTSTLDDNTSKWLFSAGCDMISISRPTGMNPYSTYFDNYEGSSIKDLPAEIRRDFFEDLYAILEEYTDLPEEELQDLSLEDIISLVEEWCKDYAAERTKRAEKKAKRAEEKAKRAEERAKLAKKKAKEEAKAKAKKEAEKARAETLAAIEKNPNLYVSYLQQHKESAVDDNIKDACNAALGAKYAGIIKDFNIDSSIYLDINNKVLETKSILIFNIVRQILEATADFKNSFRLIKWYGSSEFSNSVHSRRVDDQTLLRILDKIESTVDKAEALKDLLLNNRRSLPHFTRSLLSNTPFRVPESILTSVMIEMRRATNF